MTNVPQCTWCGAPLQAGTTACPDCSTNAARTTLDLGLDGTLQRLRSSEPSSAHELLNDLAGTLSPRFQILKRLGVGGMGIVYQGWERALRRYVAIKVMSPDLSYSADARARFFREAQNAAAVAHPNVISVYQVGELRSTKTPYFVMEYIDGRSLAELFPRGKPAPEAIARDVLRDVATALAFTHERGLVHRDVKPRNIMIESQTRRAVVLDFGISGSLGPTPPEHAKLTLTGIALGTPEYASPEQALGLQATDKSDIYSLGCVLFELLTGRPVFTDASIQGQMAAHIKEPPPQIATLRNDLGPDLAALIDRCLRKSADARPTALELLSTFGAPKPLSVEWPPPGLEPLARSANRTWHRFRLSAVASLLLLACLASEPNLFVYPGGGLERRMYSLGGAWRDNLWSAGQLDSQFTRWHFGLVCALSLLGFFVAGSILSLLPLTRDWWRGRLSGYSSRTLWLTGAQSASRPRNTVDLAPFSQWGSPRVDTVAHVSELLFLTTACLLPLMWARGFLGFDANETWFVISPRELLMALTPLIFLSATSLLLRLPQILRRCARSLSQLRIDSLRRFRTTHPAVVTDWHNRARRLQARARPLNSAILLLLLGIGALFAWTASIRTVLMVLPAAAKTFALPSHRFDPGNLLAGSPVGMYRWELEARASRLIATLSSTSSSNAVDAQAWELVDAIDLSNDLDATVRRARLAESGYRLPMSGGASSLFDLLWREEVLDDTATAGAPRNAQQPSWLALARRLGDSGIPGRWWFTDSARVRSNARHETISRFYEGIVIPDPLRSFADLLARAAVREARRGDLATAQLDIVRAARVVSVLRRDPRNWPGDETRWQLVFDQEPSRRFAEALSIVAEAASRRSDLAVARDLLANVKQFNEGFPGYLEQADVAVFDPNGRELRAFSLDTTASVDVGAIILTRFVEAFCANPREILLGFSATRLAAVNGAAAVLEARGYDGPLTLFARTRAAWLSSRERLPLERRTDKLLVPWNPSATDRLLLPSLSTLDRVWYCGRSVGL